MKRAKKKEIGLQDGKVQILFACENPLPEYEDKIHKKGRRHYEVLCNDAENRGAFRIEFNLKNTSTESAESTPASLKARILHFQSPGPAQSLTNCVSVAGRMAGLP